MTILSWMGVPSHSSHCPLFCTWESASEGLSWWGPDVGSDSSLEISALVSDSLDLDLSCAMGDNRWSIFISVSWDLMAVDSIEIVLESERVSRELS